MSDEAHHPGCEARLPSKIMVISYCFVPGIRTSVFLRPGWGARASNAGRGSRKQSDARTSHAAWSIGNLPRLERTGDVTVLLINDTSVLLAQEVVDAPRLLFVARRNSMGKGEE